MQLPSRNSVAICAAALSVFAISTTKAAGIRPPRHDALAGGGSPHGLARDGPAFPFWRWMRESAAEAVFGRAKEDTKPSGALRSRYHSDVVIRFNVTNSEEEGALSNAAQQMLLDVWSFTPDFVDIRLHKDDVSSLLTLLPASLQPSVLIPDVAAAVWATYPSSSRTKIRFDASVTNPAELRTSVEGMGNVFFSDYQPLSVITNWMRLIEAMFPSFTEMISIGKSFEGRDIYAMRVGHYKGRDYGDLPRKTILVTGGLHGREWISTSTVNYLLWSIVTTFEKEPMVTKLLEHFDIVFVPVLNPDGYDYTWQTDRLWRKSRQQTKMRFCRGLDLDHAFGYEWESTNHQTDPCSESYGGDQPFQAVEASELAKWAKNETQYNVVFSGFLDLHSYSQQILFPYSYSCAVDPPNRENLEELAVGLAKSIRLSSGEPYSVTSACEGAVALAYGATSSLPRVESGGGSAIDWFYHEVKARYSYQIKLRDTGSYGFLLPSEYIVPTGKETLNALKYFGDYLLGNNGIEKFPIQKESDQDDMWRDLKRRKR
ncbi:hypothetical protein B0T26DRAFT_640175 [Lasiosphaeria miniovina]|uniref:Inactive metallocarboxypeptidase ECM14 n=1 Tax=Lasiosphaeria miniovina TaxID=1954250 RepID=A0AA40B603_9PEZI|nr:uncharacterized protein B0T26DRAFT_640175 [Lasiosphaeria miniovina]KAK0728263.1 hypothetical protein B0T26DRAFT_640175 [Lasiosphaeria miniovina]